MHIHRLGAHTNTTTSIGINRNHQHLIHNIRPTPQPPLSTSTPHSFVFQVCNDATPLHAIKRRQARQRLVCCPSWGKSSRVENSSKSARAELRPTGLNLRPTEMKGLEAEMFRSNTHNACNEQPLSQSNSGYKWHDTNACCFWCGLAR
jgi:hypothetical protein